MGAAIDLSGLNEPQRRIARTLDEPLFVEAGAGSGKTFTLTQRVAWALAPGSGEGGAPFLEGLHQVLVITFTEAAAREIKERVRTTLRAAGMHEAALAVDDAWISTIHAMCRRILVRHALSLGLDPAFSVVADSARQELLDRAVDEVAREAREDPALAPFLDEYGLGRRMRGGTYTDALDVAFRLFQAGAALPGGLGDVAPASADPHVLAGLVRDLCARLEELGACRLAAAGAAKVAAALEVVRPLAAAAEGAAPDPVAVAEALGAVSLPTVRKAELKPAADAARSALALARGEAAFARAAAFGPAALELARRIEGRFARLKREQACLDNDDLVRLAYAAVRDHEEVRRALAGRFRLVMVDEFQDTDEVQLGLIGMLAGPGARRLCTVGDAQQSIYRFRGADVGVFRSRGREVGERGLVRLDVNYRSHADVLAFVERVCAGGPGEALMPGFMPLSANPARRDRYRARDLPRIDVEVCGGAGHAGRPTRHQVAVMAAQVADALARYRDAGERPGDMALLLGTTTNADLYIDAVRARGMECVVTGGSTFTSTAEAAVARALLHALANPRDTKSGLFPLLASEVFGLDARDLCELGTRAQEHLDAPAKRTIDRGLAEMDLYHGHEPSARLARAHEVLARALEDVRRRPVADVMADVARDSGWLARLGSQGAEGRARAANVLAAIRYVRDLTEGLGLGAARAATEFDRWLEVAKVPPASLAGDDGGQGAGTVRVMTIHASKGLEFGVCAVAECWSTQRDASRFALGRVAGGGRELVLAPKDAPKLDGIDPEELEPSADRASRPPLVARSLAARAAEAAGEAEERARLLYVALTRAREALVLGVAAASSSRGVSSPLAAATLEALSGGAWQDEPGVRAVPYGGSAPASLRCVAVRRDGSHVAAETAGALPALEGELPDDPALVVRLGTPAEATGAAPDGPAPFDLYEPDAAARPGAPVAWRPREGVFSYSSVRAEQDADQARPPAPAPRELRAEAEGAPGPADTDRATNLGSAFHELAQGMVESGRVPDASRVAAAAARWHLSARATARLEAALARWEGSELRAEALAWPRVRAEVPFFRRVDSPYGRYLEGAIDLLCSDEGSGRALVVDYKTGDAGLTPEEVRERHAMQAEFYAGVLLGEGFSEVACAFVCVERDDPASPGQPLVARYAFRG